MQQKIMAVDISAVSYGLMHAAGINGLSHDGENTGIIFGFLQNLRFLQNKIKPTVTVFTCDSVTSKRTEIFPAYKEKRNKKKKDDETLKEMLELTRPQVKRLQYKLLPYLGFNNIFCTKGYEADDIMHSLAVDYPSSYLILVTRDKDMYQTLGPMCSMFNPVSKQIYGQDNLMEEYGCTPAEWAVMKGISGCTTDEVPGVPGVGDKTALKYIQGGLNPKTKTYEKIAEAQELIDFTGKLTILPYEGTPSYDVVPNTFCNKKLLKMAKHFGFKSMENTFMEWRLV